MPEIDPEVLHGLYYKLKGYNEGQFIHDLIQAFRELMPVRISKMKEALNHKDLHELRKISHSAKSAAAIVGAVVLEKKFAALEIAPESVDAATLAALELDYAAADKFLSEINWPS